MWLCDLWRGISWSCSASSLLALCGGNPPVTGGFPSQRASNPEDMTVIFFVEPMKRNLLLIQRHVSHEIWGGGGGGECEREVNFSVNESIVWNKVTSDMVLSIVSLSFKTLLFLSHGLLIKHHFFGSADLRIGLEIRNRANSFQGLMTCGDMGYWNNVQDTVVVLE